MSIQLPPTIITANNATEFINKIWHEILTNGEDKTPEFGNNTSSFRGSRAYRDVAYLSATLTEPTQTLFFNEHYQKWDPSLNPHWCPRLVMANLRCIMLLSGNNIAEPFLHYEPRLKSRLDNYGKLPSMDYGWRLRNWEYIKAGQIKTLDQLDQAITVLKRDPTNRKIEMQFYKPEDVLENENNTSCINHISFNITKNGLEPKILMRSNSAYQLLPNNLYEFGLLLQLLSIEANIPLHNIRYEATSFHIYLKEIDEVKAAMAVTKSSIPLKIPSIPVDAKYPPLAQISKVAEIEKAVRDGASQLVDINSQSSIIFEFFIQQITSTLHPFWQQFYYPILLYICYQNKFHYGIRRLYHLIETPWKEHLPSALFDVPSLQFNNDPPRQMALLPDQTSIYLLDDLTGIGQENIYVLAMDMLHMHVNVINESNYMHHVSHQEFKMLQRQFVQPLVYSVLSVSNQVDQISNLISFEAVRDALKVIRREK